MSAKPKPDHPINFRAPEALVDALAFASARTGACRSVVIRDALATVLLAPTGAVPAEAEATR